MLLAAMQTSAKALEITRSCFPGFCLESREAFTVASGVHRLGWRVIRVSRTQSSVYVQAGVVLDFPHCGDLCEVVTFGSERRAHQHHTRRLVARLIGPIAACRKGEPDFFVNIFVYDASASPGWFEVVRNCG